MSVARMLVGIEIGGTKLQIVLGDSSGKIHERIRFAVEKEQGAVGIREKIERSLPGLLKDSSVTSIGVGFGGPVNWRTGRICRSHHIEGWSEFDLSGWLGKLSGLKVKADNDANVAALGEATHGAGVGFNPVFYVTLGSGVGGGLVVNGAIYHGAAPGECEIGHVRLDRTGTILESRCSGWAVDARIRELNKKEPGSLLAKLCKANPGAEAKQLRPALLQKDPLAQKLLCEIAEDLAFGLSHVVQLLHPEIIILGGGLSGIGEPLRQAVDTAIKPWIMEAFAPGPRIALAALGEDVVPVGALTLAATY